MSFFNTTSNRDLEIEISKGRVGEEHAAVILLFILFAIVCFGRKKEKNRKNTLNENHYRQSLFGICAR